jgi:ParB family chromosome partitioning protein
VIAEATAEAEATGLTVLDEDLTYYDYKGPAATIHHVTGAGEVTEQEVDAVYIGVGYSRLYTREAVAGWKPVASARTARHPPGE